MIYSAGASYIIEADGAQETNHFLDRHPFLTPLLDDAHSRIVKYFPNSLVTLELAKDEESTAQDEQIVVHIATILPVEEALAQLKQFDTDWWLDKVQQAQGKVVINLEFR